MPIVEVRRHSLTKKGTARGKGSHLSAEGVKLARHIGEQSAPFAVVVTSPSPRSVETAIAMGYAVDEHLAALGDITPEVVDEIGHHERWTWHEPFVEFARIISHNGPTARLGHQQRATWIQVLDGVAPDGRALIISHGRVMEAGLVTCFWEADYASWGAPFQHMEGVRMDYDGTRFTSVEFLRRGEPVHAATHRVPIRSAPKEDDHRAM